MPITLYTYDELDDEAQQKAINNLRYIPHGWSKIINDHGWSKIIIDDALDVCGLNIKSFNLYTRTIEGTFILYVCLPGCCKTIRKYHNKDSDTFKTAKSFMEKYITAFKVWNKKAKNMEKYKDVNWKPCEWFKEFIVNSDASMTVELEFETELLQNYYSMLENEYNYLTSDEGIIDTIRNNGYLFNNNGTFAGSLNYTK